MLKELLSLGKPAVRLLLRHSPPPLEKRLVETLAHLLFAEARRAGELDFMEGRRLAIQLLDFDRCWVFQGHSGRLRLMAANGEADTRISGNIKEFVLLAGRREDPDTLFFQRRLNIEGDIELSLAVKNLIDGLEHNKLPKPLRRLISFAGMCAAKGYLP